GLAILDAILAGQRDPEALAKLRDGRIKASKETIMKSLVGDYREEHVFVLEQSLKTYRHYQALIAELDQKIMALLRRFDSKVNLQEKPLPPSSKRTQKKSRTKPELRQELYRINGVDLTAIPGIQAATVHILFAELGRDVSKFPSAKHFASWLGLCPDNRISGG